MIAVIIKQLYGPEVSAETPSQPHRVVRGLRHGKDLASFHEHRVVFTVRLQFDVCDVQTCVAEPQDAGGQLRGEVCRGQDDARVTGGDADFLVGCSQVVPDTRCDPNLVRTIYLM